VKSGKYKYYNEVGFVTLGEPKGTAKRFIDFVTSGAGEKILGKFNRAGAL
jgi:ABC-type Fe3+ transport system substrate-binding protein